MGKRRDWPQYNRHLVNRGKINFWISPDLAKTWQAKKCKKVGRPFQYADHLIKAICCLRFQFKMSLRATQGLFFSIVQAMGWAMPIPSYSQICRRMHTLAIQKSFKRKQDVTDIILDTTGLKVFGAGEWRNKKYGGKRRWKKLHLAMDAKTGELILAQVTDEHVHDTTYVEKALQQGNRRKGKFLIDGIGDSKKMYELVERHNKELMTPPRNGGVIRKEKALVKRNEAIQVIRGLGGDRLARSIWSKLTGYNRRVEVESMMARWKSLYSGELKSRDPQRQRVEVCLKAQMINKIIQDQAA